MGLRRVKRVGRSRVGFLPLGLVGAICLGGWWFLGRGSGPVGPTTDGPGLGPSFSSDPGGDPQRGAEVVDAGRLGVGVEGSSSQRVPADSAREVGGKVLDVGGAAVPGARVSWTPLESWNRFAMDGRLNRILESSRWSESGADGVYRLAMGEPGQGPLVTDGPGWLWVTAFGFGAEFLAVSRSELESGHLPDVVLEPAPGMEVRVLDGDSGDPVRDARVAVVGAWNRPNDPKAREVLDSSELTDAALALARVYTTDVEGVAWVAEAPGVSWMRADDGRRHSLATKRPVEGKLELVLRGTFELALEVTRPEGIPKDERIRLGILQVHRDGSSEFGAFEPLDWAEEVSVHQLPRSDDCESFVCVSGDTTIPWEQSIGTPAVGSRVDLKAVLELGTNHLVRVVDPRGVPIGGASVIALTNGLPGRSNSRLTDSDGFALIDGVRDELIWLEASADGFIDSFTGPWTPIGAGRDGDHQEIVLERAGTLEGVVRHEGRPVETFVVSLWVGDKEAAIYPFYDREDGTFSIDTAPVGHVLARVYSATEGLGPSDILRAEVDALEGGLLEVDLLDSIQGTGRLIDGDTGEPVVGARVQVHISSGGSWKGSYGLYETTEDLGALSDSDGRWQSLGISGGRVNIQVRAEGYPTVLSTRFTSGREAVDFGDIPLYPGRDIDIRVVDGDGAGVPGVSIHATGSTSAGPVTTDGEGVAVLSNLAIGVYNLHLQLPDGTELLTTCHHGAGGDSEVEVKVGGRESLELEFVDEAGQAVEWEGVLWAYPVRDTADRPSSGRWVEPTRRMVLGGLDPGRVLLIALTPDLEFCGSGTFECSRGSVPRVQMPVTLSVPRVLVRSVGGEALSDVMVELQTVDGAGIDTRSRTTDADGIAEIPFDITRPAIARLRHPYLGDAAGVEFEFPLDGSPAEITFDPKGVVRAQVVAGGHPVTGVSALLRHAVSKSTLHLMVPDSQGRLEFRNVGQGPFRIEVLAPGLWPLSAPVDSEPYGGEWNPIQAYHTTDLHLVLEGIESERVASLGLRHLELDESVADWLRDGRVNGSLVPDADGSVRILNLPEGRYSWGVEDVDGDSKSGEFTLGLSPEASTVSIRVQ